MTIKNMLNTAGRSIPNQIIEETEEGFSFYSYGTKIAEKTKNSQVYLDKKYWNRSGTTSKYRNIFLGLTSIEIKKKVKSGEIELKDLN